MITVIMSAIYFFTFKGFLVSRIILPNSKYKSKDHSWLHESSDPMITRKSQSSDTLRHSNLNIIILLIDALRFDFYDKLPYLSKLKSKYPEHTRVFKFVADAPTTTSQRLKSLTTGSLPTFLEALYNFNSEQVIEDNLISQLKTFNSNVVVLGDDTWKYLFNTSMYFNTHYLYPSFNVWDLHTVDNGILQHLNSELESFQKSENQRNMLIAHFLGVDHCGHRYGVNHLEMDLKLQQMNEMIENVTKSMVRNDTMILIFGDHGMNDNGDHGGNSNLEVDSLLFVYSPFQELFDNNFMSSSTNDSTTTTTHTTFMNVTTTTIIPTSIPQIDLVPTLSLLLNIPIPFVNLGKIIPTMIPKKWMMQPKDRLMMIQENAHQMYQYIEEYLTLDHSFIGREEWKRIQNHFQQANEQVASFISPKQHEQLNYKHYEIFIEEIVKVCRESWATFNNFYLYIGMGLLIGTLLLLVLEHLSLIHEMMSYPFSTIPLMSVIGSGVLMVLFKLVMKYNDEWMSSHNNNTTTTTTTTRTMYDLLIAPFSKQYEYYEMIHIILCFFTLLFGIYERFIHVMKIYPTRVQTWNLLSNLSTWIDLICVILYSISLFSNSFIIYEDRMVNYLLIFRVILFYFFQVNYLKPKRNASTTVRTTIHTTSPRTNFMTSSTNNSHITWNVMILLILLNQSSSMIRYRYHSSSFIDDNFTSIIFSNHFLMKLSYLIIIYYILREHLKGRCKYLTCSNNHESIISFVILNIYLPLSLTLVLSYYQFVNEGFVEISNIIAQGLYAFYLITLISTFIGLKRSSQQQGIYYTNTTTAEQQGTYTTTEQQGIYTTTTTSDIMSVVSTEKRTFLVYFFIISMSPLLILYDHRYLYTFVILLAQYHYYHVITCGSLLNIRSQQSQIIDIFLFSVQSYFSLGHQNSMTTIHWNSAFVGISNAHMIFSGILVMLNQFSFKILLTITLNLWIQSTDIHSTIKNSNITSTTTSTSSTNNNTKTNHTKFSESKTIALQNYCKFLLLNVCLLVTSMLCAFIQRRHLMTWDIFAPKFMFDALSTLIVCACIGVVSCII
ncbi:hypothetical protein C9374_000543 [Naegleria lovaniensis]|uniref:GPI ethanolamine phosphate transferase 3 n=1 Tax=Naegleria lovaniensis TaxID=51637 RepID=A0AA88GYJ6_NAELO|nr:uncharacterized protein C9374_000543 [Naegleria lovaniensis]KAG2388379.1 hypothetical protein C9374_000543 [Naegleria lovaniensis]